MRAVAVKELTRAEMAYEHFFNSPVGTPEKKGSPRHVRLITDEDLSIVPPLQLPITSLPKGILKNKSQDPQESQE